MSKPIITIEAIVNKPIDTVWECWTKPEHITNWCFASDDWHAPSSTSDFKIGGKLSTRMEAKDGSFGFDFEAIYADILIGKEFTYSFDGRTANVQFQSSTNQTIVTITFDPETENSIEMQQSGWQAILNNFKHYTEHN